MRVVYQIAVRVLASGERALFLLDSRGCPLFYPTIFATSRLSNGGAAVNTIRNKFADIVVLLHREQQGRDSIAEFARGYEGFE